MNWPSKAYFKCLEKILLENKRTQIQPIKGYLTGFKNLIIRNAFCGEVYFLCYNFLLQEYSKLFQRHSATRFSVATALALRALRLFCVTHRFLVRRTRSRVGLKSIVLWTPTQFLLLTIKTYSTNFLFSL